MKIDILYIEDNANDADIFSRLMKKMVRPTTYTILNSGSEAISYLESNENQPDDLTTLPKIILLDLNLVGMSGFDVLEWVRSTSRTHLLPVIAFSTSDSPNDIKQAYAGGINAYIVKPGSYQVTGQLLQRVCDFWLVDNMWITHR